MLKQKLKKNGLKYRTVQYVGTDGALTTELHITTWGNKYTSYAVFCPERFYARCGQKMIENGWGYEQWCDYETKKLLYFFYGTGRKFKR